MKTRLDPVLVTIVLTSCARFDLLKRTMDSFLAFHEPARFLLVEDSADPEMHRRIKESWPFVELVANEVRMGQHRAIDRAYALVETPYILHLEDDWLFTGSCDTEHAAGVLAHLPEVSSLSFAHMTRHKRRHRLFARRFAFGGRDYARIPGWVHPDWYGYSFNPALVRLSTWIEHGPYVNFANERAVSRSMRAKGLHVAFQLPGVAHHIGSRRSVYDPARAQEKRRFSRGFWHRWTGS